MSTPPPPLDPARAGEDKGPTVTASISAVAALSTLFAAARLYVRVWIMRKFQFDDYMIVISVLDECWILYGCSELRKWPTHPDAQSRTDTGSDSVHLDRLRPGDSLFRSTKARRRESSRQTAEPFTGTSNMALVNVYILPG
ncbi:hypothetical protein DL769_001225 [Monosporascus sp. CRB-8-3]|nr:hypothetical protein DL769_001225 [Monosporascus sp. CRB-8-3]